MVEPKITDINITPTYTCQKCNLEFISSFELKIVRSQQPLCPKCSVLYRRGVLK